MTQQSKKKKREIPTDAATHNYLSAMNSTTVDKITRGLRMIFGGTAASQTMSVLFLLLLIVYDPGDTLWSNVLRSAFILLLGLWQNLQNRQYESTCSEMSDVIAKETAEISELKSKGKALLGVFQILDVPEFLAPLLPSKQLFEEKAAEPDAVEKEYPNRISEALRMVFGGAASLQSMTVLFLLVLWLYDPADPVWSNALRLAFIVLLGAWQNILEEYRQHTLSEDAETHITNKHLLEELTAKFSAMIQIIKNLDIPEELKPFVTDLVTED